ncbi:ATP-dependent helicase HrpB [Marinobacterium zhoushanense]|uniref:ATP-dependent helicase HrpB n=1 Tax=Marinobacterium zhoushanense TaxID=1679163 RepID=A0ABQ1K570_9GAMM|nr:ATP-dependent helicase HrpB [Marinobacterium zhoushanense]GGB88501.1 ATP-dependent helicase HrpB [Marinobacterium zhoushanense]
MQPLPIDTVLPELRYTLARHHEAVLEAPPGAGKTTRVPLALLDEPWLQGQKILMLEPRRLAARAAAEQLARQLGEKPGETVGYRVRLDNRVSQRTRIEVVTEGILTRMLQSDPALDGVGLLIFDEFHERSLDADLGLALALQGRELLREDPPLKLLVMSATLDGSAIAGLLGDAPIVRSEGRSYPVHTLYTGAAENGEWIEPRICRVIDQALAEQNGSLLVFLPGQGEIRRVQSQLEEQLGDRNEIIIAPLYGDLSLEQQRRAIEPAPAGMRKIVLSTAIAETSLTIEGIEVVIDSGLARHAAFDPASGMTRLHTSRVSAASATQRAGRAGRLGPGTCYRLWSPGQQEQLTPFTAPEMQQADLAPLALALLAWGVDNPEELSWLDPPPRAAWQQAIDLLLRLGACETSPTGQLRLTAYGEQMAQLPTHPRLAHLLLTGVELGLLPLAADIAALLSERDPLRDPRHDNSSDLGLRLDWLQRGRGGSQALRQRIKQLSAQYRRIAQNVDIDGHAVADADHPRWIGCLLAAAYPDRIAQTRKSGGQHYRLAGGRGAELSVSDPLCRTPWLVVAELSSRQGDARDRVRLASALDPALFDRQLGALVSTEERVEWDETQQRLIAEQQRRVGELVLERTPLSPPSKEARNQALLNLVRKKGLGLLPWNEEIDLWRARVAFCREHDRQQSWPDLSDTALLDSLEQWLAPWLDPINHINHFARLDLTGILKSLLPWPLPQQLDELAPERIRVPSGARLSIDYSQSPPVLAVKLQEMFGCTTTPSIGYGVRLKLHLLSPARRPLQVTQDLEGFWQNAYQEVKKEMKGRYPKHPWPDDPLQAPPTARTKKAGG